MASTDLLISQYRGTSVEKILAAQLASRDALLDEPVRELGRMVDVRTAAGVWLDAIGAKMGVYRPIEGAGPMVDERFRRCVLARGAILGGGSFGDGLAHLDPWATWGENIDAVLDDGEPLSIRVWTLDPGLLRLADVMGCVWRPAGVGATYYDYSLTPVGGFWATAITSENRAVAGHEIAPNALLTRIIPNNRRIEDLHIDLMSLSFSEPPPLRIRQYYLTIRLTQHGSRSENAQWEDVATDVYNGWLLSVDEAVGLPAFSLDLGNLALQNRVIAEGSLLTEVDTSWLEIPLTSAQYGELHSQTPRVFRFRRK